MFQSHQWRVLLTTTPKLLKKPRRGSVAHIRLLDPTASATGEHCFTLLHERAASFDVVLARKTVGNDALGQFVVALVGVFDVFVDTALRGENGERGIACNRAGVRLDERLEIIGGKHIVDDAEPQCFLRVATPSCKHEVFRCGRPDEIYELT